jgi:hypothetical protein
MGVVDQLVAAVNASSQMSAGKKEIVIAFLQAAGPTLESLGAGGFSAVMGAVTTGGSVADAVAASLSAAPVAALLEATEQEMAALATDHGAQVKAAQNAITQLEAAALLAIAQAVAGAL